jgi:hypothetical protein
MSVELSDAAASVDPSPAHRDSGPVAPGRTVHGPLFGEHGHWTSLVIALPIGFGSAAAAELWHMLRG